LKNSFQPFIKIPKYKTIGCFEKTIGCFEKTIGCFEKTIGCFEKTIGCFEKTIGCFEKTIGCFSLSLKNTFLLKRLRMLMLWIQSRVDYITNLPQILSRTTQQQQAQPSLQHPSKGLDSL